MKIKYLYIVLILILCAACKSKKETAAPELAKKSTVKIEAYREKMRDPRGVRAHFRMDMESGYEAPEVINKILDLTIKIDRETGCYTELVADFDDMDKIVKGYLSSKQITLPEDKRQQIELIDDICKSKFAYKEDRKIPWPDASIDLSYWIDISLNQYVLDLAKQSVHGITNTEISLKQETMMYESVLKAMRTGGKIFYVFRYDNDPYEDATMDRFRSDFNIKMLKLILKPVPDETPGISYTSSDFLAAYSGVYENYQKTHMDNPLRIKSPEERKIGPAMDNYIRAVSKWLEYRSRIEKRISNPDQKREYNDITRAIVRKHYDLFVSGFGLWDTDGDSKNE